MKTGDMKLIALFVSMFLFILISEAYVLADSDSNNTMTVSANIIGFRNNPVYEGVGIEVPDLINLGTVTNSSPVSSETIIHINNTGTVDITVTPQLADENDGIFSYLFFRKQKSTTTNDSSLIQFHRIGDYSLNISKPSSGSTVKTGTCYMSLNLTDFDGPITKDLMNYTGQVIFWAVPSD
jgi:hypothetical protein